MLLHCLPLDISLGGCYVESMYPFPAGTHLELKLQVADTLLMEGRTGYQVRRDMVLTADSSQPATQYSPYLPLTESSSFLES